MSADGPEQRTAELAERDWREHDELDEIELSEAEMAIEEKDAALRDIVFSCNEAILGRSLAGESLATMTLRDFAEQIKRKAQAGLLS